MPTQKVEQNANTPQPRPQTSESGHVEICLGSSAPNRGSLLGRNEESQQQSDTRNQRELLQKESQ